MFNLEDDRMLTDVEGHVPPDMFYDQCSTLRYHGPEALADILASHGVDASCLCRRGRRVGTKLVACMLGSEMHP